MTSPAAALVARGLDHHRRNQLDAAERLYAEALALDPDDAEALHLSGVAAQQRGDFTRSLELIGRALARRPQANYYANLAQALNQLARPAEAAAASRQALLLDPASAAARVNLGVALRAERRLAEAADSFRAAIALRPGYADAWSNLGVVQTEQDELQGAETTLVRAVELDPQAVAGWAALGAVRLRQGRLQEAEGAYRRALALKPDQGEALANLGAAYQAQGRRDEAVAAYAEAARRLPGSAPTHRSLGLLLGELKRFGAAVAALERAAALSPAEVAAWIDLGNAYYALARATADPAARAPIYNQAIAAHRRAVKIAPDKAATHYNLGLALLDRLGPQAALDAFETAIALDPSYAEAHCNLGHCLAELGRFAPAAEACGRALALKPGLAEAHSTLGNILVGQHRLAEAEAAYRQAVTLRPDLAGGWCNLGVVLFRLGQGDAALEVYDRALALDPHLADAHWNKALALLQRGEFAAGWPEYEWRLKRPRRLRADARFDQPMWDGTPLEGRRILLHAEQGLGDAIQCVRFVPEVARRGGRVVLQAPRALLGLFAGVSGVDTLVADDAPAPAVRCRLPLFSLPRLFAPSSDEIIWPTFGDAARPGAYLAAEPRLSAVWAARLAALAPASRLRVGIVWSGNRTAEVELGRSIPLARLAPLAAHGGATLVSLQKGDGVGELDVVADTMAVARLGPDYDAGDFAVTAAVVEALDLVVCCDTSIAHLAGALGKPVWLAVNAVADWRWLQDRADSPWYPSLRLYRQSAPGDWDSVFRAMAADLDAVEPGHSPSL